MSRFTAITTCSEPIWRACGQAMARTFDRYWSPEVPLWVYAEGFETSETDRIRVVDLDQAAPWLAPWKAPRTRVQNGHTAEGYRYRFDAVKFAHKIAAIGAAAEEIDHVLIWLDSDIISHKAVTLAWLESLLPADAEIGWLDRNNYYPECGFLMFRLPEARRIINQIVAAYVTGAVFKLAEWHDSYVIENVVKAAAKRNQIQVASLSGAGRGQHHVLANSPIGERLDHLKGARKALGRTPQHERVIAGGGPYWAQ